MNLESQTIWKLNQMLAIAVEITPGFKLMFADEILDETDIEGRQEIVDQFCHYHHLLKSFKNYVFAINLDAEPIPLNSDDAFELADVLRDMERYTPEASIRERLTYLADQIEKLFGHGG